MKISEITYYEYLFLSEQEQFDVMEVAKCSELIPIDCYKWTWGNVKWCQDSMMSAHTFEDVLQLAQKEGAKLTMQSPAITVLKFYLSVVKAIEDVTKKESGVMAYESTTKELTAAEAVGGFAKFGTLPQTLRLVGVIAPSIEQVEACDYGTAFMALWYKNVEADFQKQLYKQ